MYKYRVKLYPGLSGSVEVRNMKKRQAEKRIKTEVAGFACGSAIYIQRIRAPKIRRRKAA